MQNDESLVRSTADEIEEMARRGQDESDFGRVRAMTEAELEAAIDSARRRRDRLGDGSDRHSRAEEASDRLFDSAMSDRFKAQGPGYQTRMNAVLRGYVEA